MYLVDTHPQRVSPCATSKVEHEDLQWFRKRIENEDQEKRNLIEESEEKNMNVCHSNGNIVNIDLFFCTQLADFSFFWGTHRLKVRGCNLARALWCGHHKRTKKKCVCEMKNEIYSVGKLLSSNLFSYVRFNIEIGIRKFSPKRLFFFFPSHFYETKPLPSESTSFCIAHVSDMAIYWVDLTSERGSLHALAKTLYLLEI